MKLFSLLGLLGSTLAMPAFNNAFAPFANTTGTNSTEPSIPCFPFEDPHCCISSAVCQCNNGTYFALNRQYGARRLCAPPGQEKYGEDISSIPGWCC